MKKRYFFIILNTLLIISIVCFYSLKTSTATANSNFNEIIDWKSNRDYQSIIKVSGQKFNNWLKSNINHNIVPSVVAGIVDNKNLLFHSGVRADIDKKFDIASLSKTFTALLIMILVEEGEISLDEPIINYLPGVQIERPEINSSPVTVRQLLAHSSGIPSSSERLRTYEINGEKIIVPEQTNPAGYCYAYSNAGYVLLMHIIENVTGKSYGDVLRDEVLIPLEMNSSTADNSNGTGGIISTLRDISNYTRMLINKGKFNGNEIISEKSFHLLLSEGVEMPDIKVDYHYSLSWEVVTVNQKVDSFYKAGRWFGGASGVHVFPDKKIALIYLCDPPNHLTKPFMRWRQRLTGQLRHMLRKVTGDAKLCSKWPYPQHNDLKDYVGTYKNEKNGNIINITLKGNKLYSNKFGFAQPLRSFSSNRFLLGKTKTLHNFVWKDKKVLGVSFTKGFYKLQKNK